MGWIMGTEIETIPYTYGDANWKDKLTNFNGNEITYATLPTALKDEMVARGAWTLMTSGNEL